MKKFFWAYGAIIWMVGIFFFTQLPYFTGENTVRVINEAVHSVKSTESISQGTAEQVNLLNLALRKSTHVLVFGILAFLLVKSFRKTRFPYLYAWLGAVAYAATDEWHQSFMPGRVASIVDVGFDGIGAFLFLVIFYFFQRKDEGVM